MSGPSATEKPMSAKMVVSSSNTWLTGWMRPVSAADSRTGKVTSTVSVFSRASSAAAFSASRRAAIAAVTRSFSPLISGPCSLRCSGVMPPSVFNSADTAPLLPSAATRTLSSAASSDAAVISAESFVSSEFRSDIGILATVGWNRPARIRPGTPELSLRSRRPRKGCKSYQAAAGRAALAFSTIAWNAAGSWMARSDSTLRSTTTPALPRPSINRL